MNDELYKLWIQQRADAEPPADFADQVMAVVRSKPRPSSKGLPVLLVSSPAMRVAVCVLAGLAGLYRMAAVVAVFYVP